MVVAWLHHSGWRVAPDDCQRDCDWLPLNVRHGTNLNLCKLGKFRRFDVCARNPTCAELGRKPAGWSLARA